MYIFFKRFRGKVRFSRTSRTFKWIRLVTKKKNGDKIPTARDFTLQVFSVVRHSLKRSGYHKAFSG